MQSEKEAALAQSTRQERVRSVVHRLRPIAAPVEKEVEFSRWIRASNADPDEAEDWCSTCAQAEVDRLNALHPEHDYFVAGGYGTDTDGPPYCCKCEKTLTDFLSRYAIEVEIDHYSRHTVALRGQHVAERAFRFIEVLESSSFDVKDPDSWRFFRKVERMIERRTPQSEGAMK